MRDGRRSADAPIHPPATVSSFLAEVGTKIADRWMNLLVLPGLLWTAALAAGLRLGQAHPVDLARLRSWLDQIAGQPASHNIATVALAAAAIVLASASVALAASPHGAHHQRQWATPGNLPPASWLLRHRQHQWQQATTQLKTAIARAARPGIPHAEAAKAARQARAAQRRRTRIGPAYPARPTRIGDLFHTAALRTRHHNGLDLDLAWPRLWTVLPDTLRTDLTTAQDAYAAAARLAAWGILYLALTATWWPAALISLTIFCTAATRARASAAVLAALIETAADLHAKDLATTLGLPVPDGTSPAELGQSISQRLLQVSGTHPADQGNPRRPASASSCRSSARRKTTQHPETRTDQHFCHHRRSCTPVMSADHRRLSEVAPVYASSDQDVCGVDM